MKLSTIKPESLAERLATALLAEGFESNGTWIRRTLGEQLDRALSHGAALDRKWLASQVRGASAAELIRLRATLGVLDQALARAARKKGLTLLLN